MPLRSILKIIDVYSPEYTVLMFKFCCFSLFKQQIASQWWWVHIFLKAKKLSSKKLKCYGKVLHNSLKLPRVSRVKLLFRSINCLMPQYKIRDRKCNVEVLVLRLDEMLIQCRFPPSTLPSPLNTILNETIRYGPLRYSTVRCGIMSCHVTRNEPKRYKTT